MSRSLRFTIMTMAFVLCSATAIFAQRTTGDIEGKVTDPNGAVVPAVSITVTGVTVGFNRTIQSDSDGQFRIQQVPIGTYKLATAPISVIRPFTLVSFLEYRVRIGGPASHFTCIASFNKSCRTPEIWIWLATYQ